MKKLFDKNYYNYCAKLLLVVKFYRNNLNILKRAREFDTYFFEIF